MATYYFNIDNSYTTTGLGTTVSPANYTQLSSFLNSSGTIDGNSLADNDVVRIKGTYVNPTISNLSVFNSITKGITITSFEDNNPWIIDGVDDYVDIGLQWSNTSDIIIKNGIIDSLFANYGISSQKVSFKNCIIYTAIVFGEMQEAEIYFYGCTFNNVSQFIFYEYTWSTGSSVYFWDSVFINSIVSDNGANYGRINQYYSTYTNSYIDVYNSVSATSTKALTGNDYDWVPPITLPTDVSDIRANSMVFSQFNVPQTGTTSDRTYHWISLDYFSDSFYDVNRAGRGAFYFGEFEFTEYYVNNSGTSTSPYNTPETGATNFKTLQDNVNFINGDIVNLVTSGGVIDDTETSASKFIIDKSLTFRNYDGNNERAPWLFHEFAFGTDVGIILSGDACNNTTFSGLSATQFNVRFADSTSNIVIDNNTLYGHAVNGIFTFSADSNNINFFNNTLDYSFYGALQFLNDCSNINCYDNIVCDYSEGSYAFLVVSDLFATRVPKAKNINIYNNKQETSGRVIGYFVASELDNIKFHDNYANAGTDSIFIIEQCDNVKNVYIYDNIHTNGSSYNIQLTTSGDNDCDNIQIYNNTLNNPFGTNLYLDFSKSDNITNLLVKDNTLSDTNGSLSLQSMYLALAKYSNKNINILNNFIQRGTFGTFKITNYDSLGGTYNTIHDISNFIIENNIIGVDNSFYALDMDIDVSGTIDNLSISYNNFVNNTSTSTTLPFISYNNISEVSATNSKIVNNIFYSLTSATDYLAIDNFGDDNVIDYNNYYGSLEISATSASISTSGTNNQYGNPLWTDIANDNYYLLPQSPNIKTGISADDIGAVPYIGENKIGAFYFGPSEKTFVVDPLELTLEFVSNVANVGANLNYVFNPLNIFLTFPNPTILNYSDVAVDFIGIPRKGTSPLVVDFTAYVTLLPEISTTYEIVEYIWSFDALNDLTISGTSITPNISHTYTGYAGEAFDVKLTVKLDCK